MQTNELKDNIQQQALQVLKDNNYTGVIVAEMGSGKGKIAIDAIKQGKFKNILITSPRTNLKDMWRKELKKWHFIPISDENLPEVKWGIKIFDEDNWDLGSIGSTLNITLENIQTVYKWTKEQLQQFDLVVFDEIHMCGEQFFNLIQNSLDLDKSVIGLTGTPNKEEPFKKNVLYQKLPIIFEYYDSAKDGLINKRRYFIYEYELTDNYKVITGTKKKQWLVGEKSQYDYLTEQIKKGQRLMAQTGSQDWFKDAADWFWNGNGTPEQKNAARVYLQAIKYRKEFLWNLTSSAEIAVKLKEKIRDSQIANKILLFSELTTQAEKLSPYSIHSKNDEYTNRQLLYSFDTGMTRELSSVRSLTLGLNLVGANWAVLESYNGSSTSNAQKLGRLSRLDIDDIANVVIIVPIKTQAEEWFKKFMKDLLDKDPDIEIIYVKSIEELII